MKTLFSLLLIVSITIISWSTFARSNLIQVNTLYIQSSSTPAPMMLNPSISTRIIEENIALSSNNSNNNEFFEMTMIFNEKLQQIISSFK